MSLSAWRRFVLGVGWAEAVGLGLYGALLWWSSNTQGTSGATGSDVSPLVLFISYSLFAALIAWIVRGVAKGARAARSPYLLTQGFALVVAQTLLAGGEVFERVLGAALAVVAALAAFGLLKRMSAAAQD